MGRSPWFALLLLLLALVSLPLTGALAGRPPLQSDVDRCALSAQARGALVQGRPQLTLLLRRSGQVYASFARAAGGVDDLPLLRCLSLVATRWALPPAALDSRRPFELTLVPGGTLSAGGQSLQGRPSVFLPDLHATAEERALEEETAQESLTLVPGATSAERGEALRLTGRTGEAAQALREALEENPADPLALRALAALLAAPGPLHGPAESRDLAERLAALDLDSAGAHEARLAACLAQGDDECALAAWSAAKESDGLAPRARALVSYAAAVREAAARQRVASAGAQPLCAAGASLRPEERALCVVRACLDEGTRSWASALSAQNGLDYRLAEWRTKAASPGRVWVIRAFTADNAAATGEPRAQVEAVWLVKEGADLTVTAVSPEARQITRGGVRCGAGRLARAP